MKIMELYKRCKKTGFSGYFSALLLLTIAAYSCNQSPETQSSNDKLKTGTNIFSSSSHEKSKDESGDITDLNGRIINIPENTDRVICSGSGCLRYLTYLKAHDRIAAVDGIEVRGSPIDARPYAIANPQFKEYPVFGEFRGFDNPELIAGLNPGPDVIFKMAPGGGIDPDILQKKTGIPVIMLQYGNLTCNRQIFDRTLYLMAEIVGQQKWAAELIFYIDEIIADLRSRIDSSSNLTCFIGGLGQSGPHGIQSTNPRYAPFEFLGIKNAASPIGDSSQASYLNVSKEQIVDWDPDIIFIDISTLRLPGSANALGQLRHDPSFRNLKAVKNNQLYGLFPNNSYNENIEVVLANAYYIGKILYPENFKDIDPMKKAEEISVFFNGGPAFHEMNKMFENTGFAKIPVHLK